jgi:hypothetical protein
MASMGVDSDFNDTLMHVSGNIMKQAVAQAVAPWRKIAYMTPDGGSGDPQ